ncbi:TorF family putative porin [Lentiprolixibacter aurantiacus]|uniref:Lipoprotein n=1 Tax=Lentiprolixibacter aurantiacus TaxID=2993939 RepID=A0AAE3ML25_9FLAO|nr:TorF family putative porin [Lentiprolixibacter aurantiacus]MCX2718869.1 hypothetical protein [Lentiprolixibacter aurantiacus]
MRTSSKLLIAFILLFVLSNCSKNDSGPNTDPDVDSPAPGPNSESFSVVSGNIDLPEGSSLNLSSLTVSSSTNKSTISNGGFELDVYGDYTATYLADANDNVFLIGYKYPDSPNNDITSTSTALGLLMMSPSVLDLSEEGKRLLINRFLGDSNFQVLVEAIEQNIAAGNDLFDSNNTAIMQALVAVFQSSSRPNSNNEELPVFMSRAGRNFIFNAGQGTVPNVYNTIIGVYKNGDKIDNIKVKGVQIVPTSLSELFQGGGGSIGDPIDEEYTLQGDGDFTFKFRTGKPGSDECSPEHEQAFYDNLGQFSYNLLVTLIPFLETSSCATTIINTATTAIESSIDISMNTKDVRVLLLQVADLIIGKSESIISNCVSEIPLESKWLFKFLKQWNFISTAFGAISNGANTTIFGTQWITSNSTTDLFFTVSGNDVVERDFRESYVKYLDTGEIIRFANPVEYYDYSNTCGTRHYMIGHKPSDSDCSFVWTDTFGCLSWRIEVNISNEDGSDQSLSIPYRTVNFRNSLGDHFFRLDDAIGPVSGLNYFTSFQETSEGVFITGDVTFNQSVIRPVEIVLKF